MPVPVFAVPLTPVPLVEVPRTPLSNVPDVLESEPAMPFLPFVAEVLLFLVTPLRPLPVRL
jgi:hypothetical protein